MFGWRRRNDGFEWHKYVRTTIKLRREDRKRRIEEVKEAAAAGVVDAGKASASAGRSLLQSLGALIGRTVIGLGHLASAIPDVIVRLLSGAGALLVPMGRGALALSNRLEPILGRRGIPPLLLLFAVASIASGVARVSTSGFDWGGFILLSVGVVLAALASLPMLARMSPPRWSLPGVSLPGFSSLSPSVIRTSLGVVLGVVIVGGAGWIVWPQLTGVAKQLSTATLPTLSEPPLQGRARAVTGDTLLIDGQVVRLSGIEAPELTQSCRNARQRRWRCGRSARQALSKILGSRAVTCSDIRADSNGFKVGTCRIGDEDIAMRLLRRGHAFSTASSYGSYSTEETAARAEKLGIWRGPAQLPKEFRATLWNTAKQKAPDGCPIKGRVTRSGKVYLLPWSPTYRTRKVRKSRGERWFCSESDALAAGWKPDPSS